MLLLFLFPHCLLTLKDPIFSITMFIIPFTGLHSLSLCLMFPSTSFLLVWFLSFHELRRERTKLKKDMCVCKKGWMTEEQKRRKIYSIIFWANLIQYFLPCFYPPSLGCPFSPCFSQSWLGQPRGPFSPCFSQSWLSFLPLFLFLAWMKLQFSFRSADDLTTGMQQEKEQKRHKTDNRKTRIEGGKRMKREEEHNLWMTYLMSQCFKEWQQEKDRSLKKKGKKKERHRKEEDVK